MALPYMVMDLETDPFEYGEKPDAFLSGICDGRHVRQWWSDEKHPVVNLPMCIWSMLEYLKALKKPHYIYAHNGGKFDFFFLPWPLDEPIKIVNGRIIEARLGKHILRDSFAIMPFALAQYDKEEIDYGLFAKDKRDHHKKRILAYHAKDCRALFTLVDAFIQRFGPRLTIASTAMRELRKYHDASRQSQYHDEAFRPFYFGGRVQCFGKGILKGRWKIIDVNSMYPHVMKSFLHPKGNQYEICSSLESLLTSKKPGFAVLRGRSKGAFPLRTMEGLSFPEDDEVREYHVTLHELREAYRLRLIEVERIEIGYLACGSQTFAEFVDVFSHEKAIAKASGDTIGYLFAKTIQNSAYGKFATNPENHFDWRFIMNDEYAPRPPWELYEDYGFLTVWRKPAEDMSRNYWDVAIGASITGAARAVLLRALHESTNPVYCDTDSIICEDYSGKIGNALGEWKLEGEGDRLILCGKKLYCLTQGNKVIKKAHKGIEMDLKNYLTVARGEGYTHKRAAPTFKRDGSAVFIERTVRMK